MLKPYPDLHAVLKRGKKLLNRNPPLYCSCSNCERENTRTNKNIIKGVVILIAIVIMTCLLCVKAHAYTQGINITRIAMIESSNNPNAYNKYSNAVGLCQITNSVVADYNKNFGTNWSLMDLYNINLNMLMADWYLNTKIPKYLKHYKIKNTINNRLIAYNAGINTLVKHRALPTETKQYIKKYNKLNKEK